MQGGISIHSLTVMLQSAMHSPAMADQFNQSICQVKLHM